MTANVIIKSDVRIDRENAALRDFGRDPKTATAHERECAAVIASQMEGYEKKILEGR